ncbi:peptidase G2 autoproteolytic cleavage domain-containing protein [Paenibacillus sp. FSL R10-2736]|uniref:peptidase G2 autoproteolytic cleavage domain-containing protein n=1 Tax=Paenibacillus sp. FSL R10-2736 TaxID=2954692 RepID=UPI0030F74ECB
MTTKGEKVRTATREVNYILGGIIARPSIIGDANHLNWKGKYMLDEWERIKYEVIAIPAVKDEEGNFITLSNSMKAGLISSQYNPTQEHVSRIDRREWVAVGTMGKLLVRDHETCIEDGSCLPNDEGVATATPEGYRVLVRDYMYYSLRPTLLISDL